MATVELRFSASPEHVRTARLVAAAVARRQRVEHDEAGRDGGAMGRPDDAAVAGVRPGERIVLDGRQNLRPGAAVVERGRSGASAPAGGASAPAAAAMAVNNGAAPP